MALHGGSDISLISGHRTAAVKFFGGGLRSCRGYACFRGGRTRTRHDASPQRPSRKGRAASQFHNQGVLRSLLDSTIRVITVPVRRLRYAIPGLKRVVRAVAPRAVLSSGTANLPTLVAVPPCRGRSVRSSSCARSHVARH